MDFESPNRGWNFKPQLWLQKKNKNPNKPSAGENFPLLFFQLVLLLGWKSQSLSKCLGLFVTVGFPPGREPTLDPGSWSWDPGILALGMP